MTPRDLAVAVWQLYKGRRKWRSEDDLAAFWLQKDSEAKAAAKRSPTAHASVARGIPEGLPRADGWAA